MWVLTSRCGCTTFTDVLCRLRWDTLYLQPFIVLPRPSSRITRCSDSSLQMSVETYPHKTGSSSASSFSATGPCVSTVGEGDASQSASRTRTVPSAHQMQGPRPARIREEMQRHVSHPCQSFAQACLVHLVVWGLERPIVKQRTPHDVLPGHKTPIARIQAAVPVVAHHEVHPRRDNQVLILNVVRKVNGPGFRSSKV